MLKGIPEILSPELLKVLCEMGHSDRLVIADGNFPVESLEHIAFRTVVGWNLAKCFFHNASWISGPYQNLAE